MTKAKTNLPTKKPAKKVQPTIIIEGHETYERLGMVATKIDGVEHFLDRSYAQKMGRTENTIQRTVEENRLELEAYGTLRLVSKVFAVAGNGAKLPIKAHWLNADQMMILAMQSRTRKGVAFRKTIVKLVTALREGRLVYRDNEVVASEPGHAAQIAHAGQPTPALPFNLSKGLAPMPEVHAWAWSFAVKDERKIDKLDVPRAAKTDDGVTLRVIGTTPYMSDSDIAMLAGPEESLTVGDLVRANLPLFEKHGKVWTTSNSGAGGKRGVAPDHLLNMRQAGALLGLLEARGAQKYVATRVGAIFRAYFEQTLSDLCSDPTQKSNAIAIEQARVGYVIDAHGYVHRTHDENAARSRPIAGSLRFESTWSASSPTSTGTESQSTWQGTQSRPSHESLPRRRQKGLLGRSMARSPQWGRPARAATSQSDIPTRRSPLVSCHASSLPPPRPASRPWSRQSCRRKASRNESKPNSSGNPYHEPSFERRQWQLTVHRSHPYSKKGPSCARCRMDAVWPKHRTGE